MAVNRQDIIAATIRCSYRVGLPAVTMKLIGKEVGILGQGLYNHFENKDEILSASFEYCKQQIGTLYSGYSLCPEDSLETSARKLWDRYFGYFVSNPEECAFYRTYREFAKLPPPSQEENDAYLRDFWRLLDELTARHQLPAAHSRRTMLYYLRNLTPYLARAVSDGIMEDSPALRDELWQLTANGLSAFTQN